MSGDSIINLQQLLKTYVGPDKEIQDVKTSRLTAPGENFGSIMLRVDITLRKNDGTEEMLYAVAKKLPASEVFRQIFNIQVTFKNEVAFYTTVVPALKDFQRENGMMEVLDSFADFYGARISMDDQSDVVDEEAVLILENLVVSGYRNIDRLEEFSLEEAKVLLKDLAEFHGVAIALKTKKPDVFEKKVKAFCWDYIPGEAHSNLCAEVVRELLKNKEEFLPILPRISTWGQKPLLPPREPFATVTHCDLWVNNTMQKFENGKIVKNKFVDFQIYAYRSATSDLFFFLWTSVKKTILEVHLDDLLQFYHQHLINTLKFFKCDSDDFSYDKFLEEIKIEASYEFGHALQFAIFVVHGKKGGSEITELPSAQSLINDVSEKAEEKLYFMISECYKRDWM